MSLDDHREEIFKIIERCLDTSFVMVYEAALVVGHSIFFNDTLENYIKFLKLIKPNSKKIL